MSSFIYTWKCNVIAFYDNLKWMIPAAWHFRPWDSHYNIELFCKSLEVTGQTLKKYGNTGNSKKYGTRAIFSAHKLRKAYNATWLNDKSANYLWETNPITISNHIIKRIYKHSEEFYDKLHNVTDKRVESLHVNMKKEAWEYLHKHIEYFWD